MSDLEAEIKAVTDYHEARQAKRKAADAPSAMQKVIVNAFEKAQRQADLDRGDVQVEVFEC